MSLINVNCPFCNQELELDTEWVNMEVSCPSCNKSFVIEYDEEDENNIETPIDFSIDNLPITEETLFDSTNESNDIKDKQESISLTSPTNINLTKQAEESINAWLKSIPGTDETVISDLVQPIDSTEIDVYILNSSFSIRERSFVPFERPYRKENIPSTPLSPGDEDFWRYEPDKMDNFTLTINDTLKKYKCHKCHGKKVITCPQCQGSGKNICQSCNGSGLERCSTCRGRGKVDYGSTQSIRKTCSSCDGRGIKSDGSSCSSCNGNGCYYKDEHVPEWHTCPNCNGSGQDDCSNCYGTGEVTCSRCHGNKIVKCPTCDGEGELKSGFDLVQENKTDAHIGLWSSEKSFPVSLIKNPNSLLGVSQELFKTVLTNLIKEVPPEITKEDFNAFNNLIKILHKAYPKKEYQNFHKHSLQFSKVSFICYHAINLSNNQTCKLWVNLDTGMVIDEHNIINNLTELFMKTAEEETDPLYALRYAAKAYVVNQDKNNNIPLKFLHAQSECFNESIELKKFFLGALGGIIFNLIFAISINNYIGFILSFISIGIGSILYELFIRRLYYHASSRNVISLYSYCWGFLTNFPLVIVMECVIMFLRNKLTTSYQNKINETNVDIFIHDKALLTAFSQKNSIILFFTILGLISSGLSNILLCISLNNHYRFDIRHFISPIFSCILSSVLLYILVKKLKNDIKFSVSTIESVKQKKVVLGISADRLDAICETANEQRPYSLVLVSCNPKFHKHTLIELFSIYAPFNENKFELPKNWQKNLPLEICSASKLEYLGEISNYLQSDGGNVKIININDDRSQDFKKNNPSLSEDVPNKDNPFGLFLMNLGINPEKVLDTYYSMTSKLVTQEDIKEELPIYLFSAPSEDNLKKIVSEYREIGAEVGIINTQDTDSLCKVLLMSTGTANKTDIEIFASKYYSGDNPSSQLQLPIRIVDETVESDAKTIKEYYENLGMVVSCWSNQAGYEKISKKNPFVLKITSFGEKKKELLKFFNEIKEEGIIDEKLPTILYSASQRNYLEEPLKCLRQLGAHAWIFDFETLDTYQIILLRPGKDLKKLKEILIKCNPKFKEKNEDELLPPFVITDFITYEDALIMKQHFDEIGATCCVLSNLVSLYSKDNHPYELRIHNPGENPDITAALLNIFFEKSYSTDELFDKDSLPFVFSASTPKLLNGYREAFNNYGAVSWICSCEDLAETYDVYLTAGNIASKENKDLICKYSELGYNLTNSELKFPILIKENLINSEVDKCKEIFNDPSFELCILNNLPPIDSKDENYVLELVNVGPTPEYTKIISDCCAQKDTDFTNLREGKAIILCKAASYNMLVSRRTYLNKAGASAWITCKNKEENKSVVITDFGNSPDDVISKIKMVAFNNSIYVNATPIPPVVIMNSLPKYEVLYAQKMFTELGASVEIIPYQNLSSKDKSGPIIILVTSLGKNKHATATIINSFNNTKYKTIQSIEESLPLQWCFAEKEETLLSALELFRKAGGYAWLCKPTDPRTTYKIVLKSAGVNQQEVLTLLQNTFNGNEKFSNCNLTENIEIIKYLTKTSAIECAKQFSQLGADVACLNAFNEEI